MADIGPNDVLRFGLELGILASLGYWGWASNTGSVRIAATVGLPLGAAILWAVFRVPNDPGPAPVPVPGPSRLGLEAALFGVAAGALAVAGQVAVAVGFAVLVVVHYVLDRDRVERLWAGRVLGD